MRTGSLHMSALVAAWLPILVFWIIFSMVYGHVSFALALRISLMTIGTAAVLGIAVWRFCTRTPWPETLRAGFYAQHFLFASLYGMSWTVIVITIDTLIARKPLWPALMSSPFIGWQFVMGLWLYGVIAGVSYAIQTQRRAHENERRALLAETALSTARLDALRSRLHPHFLFNALHTVSALVSQDPAQAESAIEKLGDMLRYTLQETSGETVPFSEEWEFTRRYLEFEQFRYGERLIVATTIDDECANCSAPSFALQTLVENAVRHSIATRPEGGRIEITARANEKDLHVLVRDDGGNGLPPAQNGSRFGLHALRERLHAVYGDRAQLAIDSGPAGFAVSFTVPRTHSEEADDE